MGGFADQAIQIGFGKRLQRAGVGVAFVEPEQNFTLLRNLNFLALDQLVPVIVKPAGKLPALFQRQGLDGGFQLFHAHAINLQFSTPIANQKLPVFPVAVLLKIPVRIPPGIGFEMNLPEPFRRVLRCAAMR
jgi:hypothetical protein